MERKVFIRTIAWAAAMPAWLLAACGQEDKQGAAGGKTQTYTCSMHPQIVRDKPGKCPICGMDLVPFDKSSQEAFLTLNDSQIALANIITITVGAGGLSDIKQLNGRLAVDPEGTAVISSRVPGRVEALYVKETGVKVQKGQALYKIYSEQLASLQQEYLLAAAQARQFPDDTRFRQIEQAARQKLALYDQSGVQTAQLLQAQKVSPYVTYSATVSGVVAELSISEGQYVPEGGAVMRIEGYDRLWVEADVYPAEAASINTGQPVKVLIAGWEQEPLTMNIQFINPAIRSGSQLIQIRGAVPNPRGQWQPGQQATIMLPVKSSSNVLSLPVDAVIRENGAMHVWVERSKGKFEPRRVKTGMENADAVAVTEGLQPGDKVVVSGAYLLYSEYILKKGADPMAAHHH